MLIKTMVIVVNVFSFEQDESDEDDDIVSSAPVIGFTSAIVWLVGMTAVIAILSDYVVSTIEVKKIKTSISFWLTYLYIISCIEVARKYHSPLHLISCIKFPSIPTL